MAASSLPPTEAAAPHDTTTTTTAAAAAAGPTAFTPATRISELNDTDLLISTLLSSAATATGILSNSPHCTGGSSSSTTTTTTTSLADAQAQLTQSIDTFFSSLNTIEVRLRRNIYALEEAGLIEAGDEKDAKRGRVLVGGVGGTVTGGGGALDSSWLNARADNGVMAGVKKQVVAEVKEFLAEWKEGATSEDKKEAAAAAGGGEGG